MSPDAINGSFELLGALFIWLSISKAYKDKEVKGVDWRHTGFFSAWGFWNLYYYPSLEQWMSFIGGIAIVVSNTIWLGQILYYARKNGRR